MNPRPSMPSRSAAKVKSHCTCMLHSRRTSPGGETDSFENDALRHPLTSTMEIHHLNESILVITAHLQ